MTERRFTPTSTGQAPARTPVFAPLELPGSGVPPQRVRRLNEVPVPATPGAEGGPMAPGWVLYWMTGQRRLDHNWALERAAEWARHLGAPLLVFEGLRVDYPHASRRLHRFCLDGMAEHRRRLEGSRVGYFPWVEPEVGAGKGLLAALADRARIVVADDVPTFFLPRMLRAAAAKLPVPLEAVDSNGLLPLSESDRVFTTAYSFRRHLQKALPDHLEEAPRPHPLTGAPLRPCPPLPDEIRRRWPPAAPELLRASDIPASIPVDRAVPPVEMSGGGEAAGDRLEAFLKDNLATYHEDRNHPDRGGGSGLSPWLHWGHLSAHEVLHRVLDREGWTPDRLAPKATGSREGWWGLGAGSEAFLDELVTWREIGYRTAWHEDDPEHWDRLPQWARETLLEHAEDPRPETYDLEELEEARTGDEVWNAAQRELRGKGTIHNYLRMLWGKKVLEWAPHPEEALRTLLHLNNRWAVDGRNPNSTSGISWVLGRYDRGWPERAVFGKVRSMTTRSTRRKIELDAWLRRWGPTSSDRD